MLKAFYIWCLIFLIISQTEGNEPLNCNAKETAKTTSMKLKLKLLCDYDKYIRPVKYHTNQTIVQLILAPRVVTFEDQYSTIYVISWLSMQWKDEHLLWDPVKYDDIKHIVLDTQMVWVPDLSVYNAKDEENLNKEVAPAIIDHSGTVYIFLSPTLTGHCVPNWANWPYDVHNCTITLGSKSYMGSTLNFTFINAKGILEKLLLPDKDWEVVSIKSNRNETSLSNANESEPVALVTLNYYFTLRRHASVYVASYVIPGVVMMLMSLALLWIPSHSAERTAVLCTLVILQSLYLQYLAYKIPSNGDTTPFLVCFYRDCLTLTGLLILETLVTRTIASWNAVPSCVENTFQFIARNRVLQFILISDLDPKSAAKLMETGNEEGSVLVMSDEKLQQSQILAGIVNRACFILLVPIYILLSLSLLPLNYSVSFT